MMRNPLVHYKDEIEQALNYTTTQQPSLSSNLTEEEIVNRNNFIMDFIVKQ